VKRSTAVVEGPLPVCTSAGAERRSHAELSTPCRRTINWKEKKEVSPHAYFPPMVDALYILLAFGDSRADRLPIRVAVAAALPHRRSRRSRSSGNHLHRDHSPLQAVGCAVSNLVRLEYVP
jgi:hypothetical protein